MKDCIKCGITCLAVGMLAGAVIVAKNKKVAKAINDGTDKISQTFSQVKEDVQEKVEEMQDSMQEQSSTKNKKKN